MIRSSLPVLLALGLVLQPTAALAAEPASTPGAQAATEAPSEEALREAGKRYEAGLALYGEGEFKLAAIEFERAYSLVPDYRVLYNIGQVRIQLGEYARARRTLDQYLKDGGDRISEDRRTSVETDLRMLAGRTATLNIKIDQPGAEVLVDDRVIGTSPLPEPLLVDAGEHRVLVRMRGREPRETRVTLAGLDALDLNMEVGRTIDRPAPTPIFIDRSPKPETSSRTTWLWATWSATGVFAAGAGITGALGISAANELDELRNDRTATRPRLDSAQRRASTLLTTADVLGSAAIVTGGIALYLTLSRPSEAPKKRGAPAVEPVIAGRWAGVRGSF